MRDYLYGFVTACALYVMRDLAKAGLCILRDIKKNPAAWHCGRARHGKKFDTVILPSDSVIVNRRDAG